jgi:transcription initiation factor IIF auxiliary subunit
VTDSIFWCSRAAAQNNLSQIITTMSCKIAAKSYNTHMKNPTVEANKKQSATEFFLEFAAQIQKDVPQTELEKLPTDGAKNHDHYLYGAPKR